MSSWFTSYDDRSLPKLPNIGVPTWMSREEADEIRPQCKTCGRYGTLGAEHGCNECIVLSVMLS